MAKSVKGDKFEAADDASLIRACAKGNERAWEVLILRHRRLVYSIAIAHRLDDASADDVMQRVALKLLEHLGKLRKAGSVASWIGTVARRECLDLLRARRREGADPDADAAEEAIAEAPGAGEILEAIEREHLVALAFDRLSETCRTLLRALYVEDPRPSYEEIGRRLGRPVGSLGPTRGRCLTRLRKLYEAIAGERP